MSSKDIKDLISYFRPAQPNLVGSVNYNLPNSSQDPNVNNEVSNTILNLLINTVDYTRSGLIQTKDIIDNLKNLDPKDQTTSSINDGNYIKVLSGDNNCFPESEKGKTISSWRTWGTKSKNLSIALLNAPFLSFSTRDLNRLVLFLNSIPTVDLSLSQPMLDVKFETLVDSPDNFTSLSIVGDLRGEKYSPVAGSADAKMLQFSTSKAPTDNTTNSGYVARAGMELFQSPQTMSREKSTSYLESFDPFRPLASIENFEVTVAPSAGAFTYKTAKLNILIHDRSRLGSVAQLLRPSNLPSTSLSISYGWSHPDKSGNNSFANLLNSMVVREEKYNIVNSSFTMDNAGGVKVSLQLAMKGSQATKVGRIIDGEQYISAQDTLSKIAEALNELREKTGIVLNDLTKEIRPYQIIDSVANNAELPHDFTEKDKKLIRDLIKKMQTSSKKGGKISVDSLNQLNEQLENFYKVSNDKNKTVNNILDEKIKKISTGPDPFLQPDAKYWVNSGISIEKMQDGSIDDGKQKAKQTRPIVSIGKLMTSFVSDTMSSMNTESELQFFYYPLNYSAGKAAGSNIAAFPIEISRLRDVLEEQAKKSGNPNFTLNEFVSFINSNFINDVRSYAYGMKQYYNPATKLGEQPTLAANKKIDDVMASITAETGGNFKMPVVEVYIETTSARPTKITTSDLPSKEITRVHIYDKLHSSFEPLVNAYRAQSSIQQAMDEKKKVNGEPLQKAVDSLNQLGIQSSIQNGGLKFSKKTSSEDVKRAVSTLLPTVKYGSQNTTVLAASVQTLQNQLLNTVNMQRTMGKRSNSEPNGSSVGAIPLRVQPAQMNLTLVGCPLLNVNQQLFFDFETGTTIDNQYLITSLSHTIAPGSFKSTAQLSFLDSYGIYESVFTKAEQLGKAIKDIVQTTKT